MAVAHEHPPVAAAYDHGDRAAGAAMPQRFGGISAERVIGLSGAFLEWALIPIRVFLAAAVLLVALVSDGMESARPLWIAVLPAAALYGGVIAILLHRGRVRLATATGIGADMALATAVFAVLHFVVSRDDPGNLEFAAQPAMALVALAVMMGTLRLRPGPAIVAGVFMTVIPPALAWAATAEGAQTAGVLGGALRFAAAAVVSTVVGQAIQRARADLERQVARSDRLFIAAERRAEERELLAELGRIVSESPDIRETYERFAQAVRAVLPADRVALNIYDPAHNSVMTTYVSGTPVEGWEPSAAHMLEDTPLGTVIRERHGMLITGTDHESSSIPSIVAGARSGLRAAVVAPLLHRGEVIGTLGLRSRDPRAYDQSSLELLDRISAQVAPAVANAELYARLERDAEERSVFAEISRVLSASPDISAVYDDFVALARKLIRWDRISINIADSQTGWLRVAHAAGLSVSEQPTGATRPPGPGAILEHVTQTGESLRVDDITKMRDRFPGSMVAVRAGIRSGIYVPLRADGVVIGAFAAGAVEPEAYTDSDLRLLERMAAQIAGTIANAELRERSERQAREEAALAEIGRVMTSSRRIEDVYDRFAEQVRALMPADRISVAEVLPGGERISIRFAAGMALPESLAGGREISRSSRILDAVIRSGKSRYVPDLAGEVANYPGAQAVVDTGLRSAIFSPLMGQGEVIGVLCVVATQVGAYDQSHAILLERIAGQVAGALANATLLERTDRQAREEAALAEIGRIVNSSLDIEHVYEQFAEQAARVLRFDRLVIARRGPGGDEFTITHVAGVDVPGMTAGSTWKVSDTPLGPVLADGRTVFQQGPGSDQGPGVNVSTAAGASGEEPAAGSRIKSSVVVPIIERDLPVGFFSVRSLTEHAYTEADAVLARRVAALVSTAITNAELLKRSERQAREEFALAEIGRIITSSFDIEGVYERFAEQVRRILPFDRLAIAITEPDGAHFKVAHAVGIPVRGLEPGTVRKISDTNMGPVLERGESVYSDSGTSAPLAARILGESEGLASSLAVPLIARDRPIGFLAVRAARHAAFTGADEELAHRVAALVSTAIENARLYTRADSEARERAILAEIGRIAGSSLDIDSVWSTFAEQVRRLIDFDQISVLYMDRNRRSLMYAWAEGEMETGFGPGREIPIDAMAGSGPGSNISRRQGAVLDEAEIGEVLRRLPWWSGDSDARSMMVVPLIAGDEIIAVLALASAKPGAYGERELETATRIGGQVAGAIANARLHAALREASEDLKDINTQKTELMTTVAHELRGPLTALRAYMDLVLDGSIGPVPERQHDVLTRAFRSTTRMQGLLNVFSHLEMAEDRSVPLTVTVVDLGALVEVSLEILEHAASRAGVEVTAEKLDGLPMIEGDRQAIEQVVSNLLSNAIKYSHRGGAVKVTCGIDGDGVVVSVSDEGMGISEHDRGRLFERFYRGTDATKLRMPGTGLGLYVSRGLVERHHGRMWVESEPGKGATFSFSLPFEQPSEGEQAGDVTAA